MNQQLKGGVLCCLFVLAFQSFLVSEVSAQTANMCNPATLVGTCKADAGTDPSKVDWACYQVPEKTGKFQLWRKLGCKWTKTYADGKESCAAPCSATPKKCEDFKKPGTYWVSAGTTFGSWPTLDLCNFNLAKYKSANTLPTNAKGSCKVDGPKGPGEDSVTEFEIRTPCQGMAMPAAPSNW